MEDVKDEKLLKRLKISNETLRHHRVAGRYVIEEGRLKLILEDPPHRYPPPPPSPPPPPTPLDVPVSLEELERRRMILAELNETLSRHRLEGEFVFLEGRLRLIQEDKPTHPPS